MKNPKHSLLWEVTPPNTNRSSYLFGTMHVKTPAAFKRIQQLEMLIHDCEVFATEIPLDQSGSHPLLLQALRPMPGKRLLDCLSQKKILKMRKQLLKSIQVDILPLQQLRPMFIATMIDEKMMPSGPQTMALDHFLWQIASNAQKTLSSLESIEDQVAVLERIPPNEEAVALYKTVIRIAKHRQQINKLLALYDSEDIVQLYKTSKGTLGKWRYVLLKKRNYQMSKKFLMLSQEQSTFAAVGAAHLAGKEGVLRLLKKAGCKIKAIDYKK